VALVGDYWRVWTNALQTLVQLWIQACHQRYLCPALLSHSPSMLILTGGLIFSKARCREGGADFLLAVLVDSCLLVDSTDSE